MITKKAALGEGTLMIYRMVLVSLIAVIVLGMSSIYYDYSLNVRDAEAQILSKQIVNCIAPEGKIENLSIERGKLLDYCDIKNVDRFYVNMSVGGLNFWQGDSGAIWVKNLFSNGKIDTEAIEKYKPGFYSSEFPVLFGDKKDIIKLDVFVSHDE